MPPAMRYLPTLSLFLPDKLTARYLLPTNIQNFAIFSQLAGLRRLVFFTYPCLSLLKPMSMSPRWQCRLSVVLLVTTLVRGLVGTSGLSGVYNRKYMSWARRKYIFGFILHILTCTTCLVVVIRRLSCQKSCISGLQPFSLVSNRELLQKKPSSDTWKKRG